MKKIYLITSLLFAGGQQLQAQVNLTFGLIAQYNFTDQSLDDSGPNFLNLINNNGATPVADRFGNPDGAYQFDGVDDYMSASNDPILTLGNGATISLWINLPDVTSNQKLIGKLTTPPISTDGGYLIGVENGQVSVETWIVGSTAYSFTAGNLIANQWNHIAVTFLSTNVITLHINGNPIDSITVPDGLEANTNDLIIGAAPWDPSYFKTTGAIDDIRIYNRKINNAELNAIYTEVVTGTKAISKRELSIYANAGAYHFNAGAEQKISRITLTDINGAVVTDEIISNVQTASLELTGFAQGLYFATVYTNTGQKTFKLVN